MNTIIERTATNLMTGQKRTVIFTKVENHNFNISNLWTSSDGGYYTLGLLGWFNIDKYLHEKAI